MREREPAATTGAPRMDAAIERAVRRAVEVDPPAGFDARVRTRIEEASRRRPMFSARHLAAAASLAVVLIAAGTMLWRPERARQERPRPAPPQVAATDASGTRAATHAPRTRAATDAPAAREVAAPPAPLRRVPAPRSEVRAEGVDAPRAPAPIVISTLAMTPLRIEPLRVPPMPAGDRSEDPR